MLKAKFSCEGKLKGRDVRKGKRKRKLKGERKAEEEGERKAEEEGKGSWESLERKGQLLHVKAPALHL